MFIAKRENILGIEQINSAMQAQTSQPKKNSKHIKSDTLVLISSYKTKNSSKFNVQKTQPHTIKVKKKKPTFTTTLILTKQ